MATAAQATEKVTDLLQNLKVDSQSPIGDSIEMPSNPDPSTHAATLETSVAGGANATNSSVDYESGLDAGMYYAMNGFAAPHGYYYGGYEYPMAEWEEYMGHVSGDGVEVQNTGVYSENGPILYHPAGYGYGPHLYGPYTPGTPIPAMRSDGQLYGAQGYSYTGHMYQQSMPPNAPFIPSSAPVGIDTPTTSAGESSTDRAAGTVNSGNNGPLGARSSHTMHSSGPYGRGILPVSVPTSDSQDVRVSHEGRRTGAPWLDSSKEEVKQRHGLSQPASASGQSVRPVAPLLPYVPSSQHHRPPPGVSATAATLGRVFQPSARMYPGTVTPGRAAQGLGTNGFEPRGNGRNWIAVDKGKPWGRGNGMVSNGNSSSDILNEQNRGPRTTRIRNQRIAPGAVRYVRGQSANGTAEPAGALADKDQYNRSDFAVNYDKAIFFIIKSYSEDDIHKSIKYSVWASTANGNKKLDAAYQEAQASSGYCPLFLFFSVNASGQFCGVAEMLGPVDFNKTLDFWQQDKWTGKFPVKWHIIKDVPNNQFRHIILENNDNKPVTNSRDTQEVRFDKGMEMLNIFKNFVFKTSILDDFQFYENRQKAMQEKRARQQAHLQHQQVIYRGSKDFEHKSLPENVTSTLQEGRPVEAVEQSEKPLKATDQHVSSNSFEKCNGIPVEDVQIDKILSRSESRENTHAGAIDSTLISKDIVSGSL